MRFFKGNKKSKEILKEELGILEDRFTHVNELIEYNLDDREYFINKLYVKESDYESDYELADGDVMFESLEALEEEYKELVEERQHIINDMMEIFNILN